MKNYLKYLLILPLVILAGIAVFLSRQKTANQSEPIRAVTESDRHAWLMLQGWNSELLSSRPVTIPAEVTESFTDYANLQVMQHLPLLQYTGKQGIAYTYKLENSNLYAELLTAEGMLIGAECYDPAKHEILTIQGKSISGMPESYPQ